MDYKSALVTFLLLWKNQHHFSYMASNSSQNPINSKLNSSELRTSSRLSLILPFKFRNCWYSQKSRRWNEADVHSSMSFQIFGTLNISIEKTNDKIYTLLKFEKRFWKKLEYFAILRCISSKTESILKLASKTSIDSPKCIPNVAVTTFHLKYLYE